MIRSTVSRILWVARATATVFGLALVLALVFGISSMALAGTGVGAVFNLGQTNAVNALNTVVGTTSSSMLRIDNSGTGSALQLLVRPNRPPLTVSAGAGKATNLNADKLDNRDSSAFSPSEIYEKSVTQTIPPDNIDNGITVPCDQGDVAVSGSYRISKPDAYLKVFGEERVDEEFDAERGQTSPSAWHVYVDNPDTTSSGSITVYVNCADRPPLHP